MPFLPSEEAQAGSGHSAGDPATEEGVRFSRQGNVAGRADEHKGEDPVSG
jgi:hypothetical protein